MGRSGLAWPKCLIFHVNRDNRVRLVFSSYQARAAVLWKLLARVARGAGGVPILFRSAKMSIQPSG